MRTLVHRTATQHRKLRVRSKLFGTADRPRLSVDRSNKHVFLQAIDDEKGITLASAHDSQLKKTKASSGTGTERAVAIAKALAEVLKEKKITKLVFDRGSYRYHGRVKAVAEALRETGIEL